MNRIDEWPMFKFALFICVGIAMLLIVFLANERNRLWLAGERVSFDSQIIGVSIGSSAENAKTQFSKNKFKEITGLFNEQELTLNITKLGISEMENENIDVHIFLDETWRQGVVTLFVKNEKVLAIRSDYGWPI